MAVLPSPNLVAGENYPVYEAWYKYVDAKNIGSIGALDAANFLKKSGLSSAVLGKVWDLSDPNGKGYLDRNGFFVALKLIALAQKGIEINLNNISVEAAPPNMGMPPPTPVPVPASQGMVSSSSAGSFSLLSPVGNVTKTLSWIVTPTDKGKYDTLFDSLSPLNGKLPGSKVKEVLVNSTLPLETLGKIWELADIDQDGALDRHEFTVAMHLVYKVLDNYPLPVSLPPELLPATSENASRRGSTLLSSVVTSPEMLRNVSSNGSAVPWVVSEADRTRYAAMFIQADLDKDGFVSGLEIKDVFLQSRLPQPILAHIWGLCDMSQQGKLTMEQFCLAMWLIQLKVQGRELPSTLAPEMIPPSLRPKEVVVEDLPHTAELEQVAKEIESLILEKRQLETEIAQKEADIRIRNGEVRNLQTELDTLSATFKQLETQKREAQKRLDDLDSQRSALEQDLNGVERQIEEHEKQVRTFRTQAEEQEKTLQAQEAEVFAKKQELTDLKSEELRTEQQMQSTTTQLDKLTTTLQDTQQQISQIKARIVVLKEHQDQMNEALVAYDDALEQGDPSRLSDDLLLALPAVVNDSDILTSPLSDAAQLNGDGTSHGDPFSSLNGPVRSSDPFKDSEFFQNRGTHSSSGDPFGGATRDPFASAFGASNTTASNSGSDPFGSDPFNSAKSPSGREESPTPALPPKKSKQPPPRPAPPKAGKAPQRPAPPASHLTKSPHADPFNDPFSSSATSATSKDPFGGSGFADFASFDDKLMSPSAGDAFDAWGISTVPTKTTNVQQQQQHRYAEFEFTEDPFKDVGFGDPFASISEDPFAAPPTNSIRKKISDNLDPFAMEKDPFAPFSAPSNVKMDFDSSFSSDAAWSSRSDPFNGSTTNKTSSSIWGDDTQFSAPTSSRNNGTHQFNLKPRSSTSTSSSSRTSTKLSEEDQIAWASSESVRLEQERLRKAELQEKADLEMAIALSKSEVEHRMIAEDRLI